ncbi:uncharacterized protein [Argopecten irradians]|uniref:uncharacterized protein n=1 Tax=Argopecten irradians TaxID=31199 RepID=UPI003715B7EF
MVSNGEAFLSSVDVFINFTVIATLVVFFWRGTWDLLDVFFIPANYELSLWISLVGATTSLMILAIVQDKLNVAFAPNRTSALGFCVVSRLHAYFVASLQVCQWRGSWGLLDLYQINHWKGWICSFVSILFLSVLGSLAQATASPLAACHDSDKLNYFTVALIGPITETDSYHGWLKVLSGSAFTIIVVSLSCLLLWHGVWDAMDIYVLPDDLVLSAYVSLAVSIFLALPILTGERFVRNFCGNERINLIVRTVVEKVYIMTASLLTIAHWRGVWYLQTAWILPNNLSVSASISHLVGIFGLVALFVSRTANGMSSFDDRDIYGGDPSVFALSYISRIRTKEDELSPPVYV